MIHTTLKYILLSSVMFSIFLVACNQKKESAFKSENGIKFDSIQTEEQFFLDDNPDNPSCNLSLKLLYPIQSDYFEIEKIQKIFITAAFGAEYEKMSFEEAVNRYTQSYIENYKTDAEIYKTSKPSRDYDISFEDIYRSDDEHHDLPEIFYSYFENISNEIIFNRHGVLSFQVIQTNNKGGKVSHESIRNYTINLANEEILTEEDIFSAGFDEALRPIIQNLLMEKEGVKTIQQLEDLGFFGIEEIVPNKNFLITQNGIKYTFNKGEYSAYQLPAAEIMIPYASVRSLIRENSIAGKLSKTP